MAPGKAVEGVSVPDPREMDERGSGRTAMCVHRHVKTSGMPIVREASANCKSFLDVQRDLEALIRRGMPL
jgi:hypothetical protein